MRRYRRLGIAAALCASVVMGLVVPAHQPALATDEAPATEAPGVEAPAQPENPESGGAGEDESGAVDRSGDAAASGDGAAAESSEDDAEEQPQAQRRGAETLGVGPLAVGGPETVSGPYLFWSYKDQSGAPIAGATFTVANTNGSTNRYTRSIPDCVAATVAACSTAADKDPDPGEFQVTHINANTNGSGASTRAIAAGQRYRVTVAESAGYVVSPNDKAIPGSSYNANPTWTGGYNFDTALGGSFIGTQFCAANANKYWSLGTTNGSGTPTDGGQYARLYSYTLNSGGSGWANSSTGGATQVAPASGQFGYSGTNANGLGIGKDGIAYFTTQSGTGNPTVTFYKADLSSSSPAIGQFGSTFSFTSGYAYLTSGAVDPRNGHFYFGYYERVHADDSLHLHLFRMVPTGANSHTTAKIGVFKTAAGTWPGGESGDFTFDGLGNLTFLVSTGNLGASNTISGRTFLIRADQIDASNASTGDTVNTNVQTISGLVDFGSNPAQGVGGLAYTAAGNFVVQQQNRHTVRTPSALQSLAALANSTPTFQRDIASCIEPPTFELRKDVAGRAKAGDQFELRAAAGSAAPTTEVTDGPATGVQTKSVGPFAVSSGGVVNFSEAGVGQTNLSEYAAQWQCSTGASGQGTGGSVTIPANGGNVVCTIRNADRVPRLVATKRASPAKGTIVDAEQTVLYTLRFDNSAGTAPATIDHADHLADVLDDADFANAAGTRLPLPGDGALSGFAAVALGPGLSATWSTADRKIALSGQVPAGAVREATIRVKVKANSTDAATRAPVPSYPSLAPVDTTSYHLNNHLVAGSAAPPASCAPGDAMCTDHPVRAWSVTKLSQPAPGATMNTGGTPNYTILVAKSDPSVALQGVRVVDDMTDVLKVAEWDPTIVPPSPALPQGIYFYDANDQPVGRIDAANLPAGTTLADWIPAPVYDDATGRWTLTTARFDLPANALYAHVRFSVRLGTPQAAPAGSQNWNPPSPAQPGTTFGNTVTADATGFDPSRCVTGTPAGQLPAACKTEHTLTSSTLTFRKDGIVADAQGQRTRVTDLVGHEFAIHRADASGQITDDLPTNACVHWNSPTQTDPADPQNCWRFYAIPSGAQEGRWRSERLPAGDYWLVETRAPDRYNDEGVLKPIHGVQMLAEPIPFRVASAADAAPAGSVPIANGQPAWLVSGQIDVYRSTTSASGAVQPRCDTVSLPTACVNPTGYLMIVSDVAPARLPLAGGADGTGLLAAGGAVALVSALAGALWWRRRQGIAAAGPPTNAGAGTA